MNEQLTNILWSLSLKNGLILVAKQMGGKIVELAGEQQTTVRSGIIIGFGRVDITFVVGDATKTGSGFMLGPLLLGVQ